VATAIKQSNTQSIEGLKRFNERFAEYRQATQWVVQLAFTLIASATITVILSTVLRR
jgi:hypothetical protein